MYIHVVAATAFEIQPLVKTLEADWKRKFNHEVGVSIAGVGIPSTVYSLMKLINARRPDFLIQAGIAGGFGSVYDNPMIVGEDRFGDMGVTENGGFRDLFDLKLIDADESPFTAGALINPWVNSSLKNHFRIVNAITVNQITTDPRQIEYYAGRYNAEVESLEGAAFHYTCLLEQIPFVQLRTVSNVIGERDKQKWRLDEAVENLSAGVLRLLETITALPQP
jgi:futalosine hydrolase